MSAVVGWGRGRGPGTCVPPISAFRIMATYTTRLRRDFAALQRDPPPFIHAAPLETNIREWYAGRCEEGARRARGRRWAREGKDRPRTRRSTRRAERTLSAPSTVPRPCHRPWLTPLCASAHTRRPGSVRPQALCHHRPAQHAVRRRRVHGQAGVPTRVSLQGAQHLHDHAQRCAAGHAPRAAPPQLTRPPCAHVVQRHRRARSISNRHAAVLVHERLSPYGGWGVAWRRESHGRTGRRREAQTAPRGATSRRRVTHARLPCVRAGRHRVQRTLGSRPGRSRRS